MDETESNIELVSDFGQCDAEVRSLLCSPQPAFLSRIGGSDTDVVAEYFNLASSVGREEALRLTGEKFSIVKRYNGYYDKADDPAKIAQFCELLIESYQRCSKLMVCGARWLTEFLPDSINPVYHKDITHERHIIRGLAESIGASQRPVRFYPYSYVERILAGPHTLFRALSETLPGMRVLAVTPFEQSIRANFTRRHKFLRDYSYPEFDLRTYNTPITYQGLPDEFYPDADWFETLDRMKREISQIEFDIALLSCGSYTMPIGLHIRDVLKRKAIFGGGCLQLYFGISGRRYDNPFFTSQINQDAFILPLERGRYLKHVEVGPQSAKEAFGAYF